MWDNNNNNNFHYHHSLTVEQMPSPVLSVMIISLIHQNCVILCNHHFIDGEIQSQRGEITYPRSMKDSS